MAESQKPKNMYWNPVRKRWEVKGIAKGNVPLFVDDSGLGSDVGIRTAQVASITTLHNTRARIGDGGTISLIKKFTGTLPAITGIGSGATAVNTLSNVASAGIAVGDLVFGNVKAALGGHTGLGGFFVPTTNVVNAYIQNTKPDSAGSFVAVGADILVLRSS